MDRPALAEFRHEVNVNVAFGEVELPVVSVDGTHPVIVALEEEPLFALLGRLRAIGGFANLFVRGPGRVWQASVVDAASAIPEPDEHVNGDERPRATATVGMFIEYLQRHPNGVVLSLVTADPSRPALARDAHTVEFAPV
jgi:hypothetical protein